MREFYKNKIEIFLYKLYNENNMGSIVNTVKTKDTNNFEGYGVFSKKQFDNCLDDRDSPYIYYKTEDGRIVQVTEVFNSNKKSKFNDAVYLGRLVEFIGSYKEPLSK
jgi:hypothetical protein|tara:strand:- start:88 stop:408 length:321 start_codon:yes stop_codon:yes gene_type:complete